MNYIATVDGHEYNVEIIDEHHIGLDGVAYRVDFDSVSGQPLYSLLIDGRSFEAYIYPSDEGWDVLLHGDLYDVRVEDEREKRLRVAGGSRVSDQAEFTLKAPMPGLVVAVPVQEGQQIEKGDVLVILESMKMQNELRSPRAGRVSRVRIRPNDSVEQKQALLSVT